ncbi:hypothetical protein FNV43_RR00452 [Rhamnella rubrinervis]|uniref:RNase H type-1 domain-containing protein n=1 Tax=Rhamnella rubrinervis TaxID=2594499 RepID=A0A8K0MSE9_9ROSA|nr:hypothetical protein FNV43_RR00452 [Rhamnella rubrinervis]
MTATHTKDKVYKSKQPTPLHRESSTHSVPTTNAFEKVRTTSNHTTVPRQITLWADTFSDSDEEIGDDADDTVEDEWPLLQGEESSKPSNEYDGTPYVNTDGDADGCPGLGGCGGYFVTSRGFIKGSFTVPLDSCYAFESELLGAIFAIECARDFRWDHLWLEYDSTYVANSLIRRENIVPYPYKSRWMNYICYVSSIQFQVSHIFREGNIVVDTLSKIVVSSSRVQWWWVLPNSCTSMHYRNVNEFENYRFRK